MNDLNASDELIDHIKPTESLALTPYTDAAGFVTWGYGHKRGPGEAIPPSITEAQADALLEADLNVAGAAVRRHVTVEMTQAQYDGLTDFCFNLGEGNLAGSTMLHLFNAGDIEGAAEECRKWDHAHVAGHLVVLAGLKTRREWDAVHIDQPSEHIIDNSAPIVWAPGEGPNAVNDPNLQDFTEREMLDADPSGELKDAPLTPTPEEKPVDAPAETPAVTDEFAVAPHDTPAVP